ncbi:unnamed protein product, partial [Prorocentrum cordatum]
RRGRGLAARRAGGGDGGPPAGGAGRGRGGGEGTRRHRRPRRGGGGRDHGAFSEGYGVARGFSGSLAWGSGPALHRGHRAGDRGPPDEAVGSARLRPGGGSPRRLRRERPPHGPPHARTGGGRGRPRDRRRGEGVDAPAASAGGVRGQGQGPARQAAGGRRAAGRRGAAGQHVAGLRAGGAAGALGGGPRIGGRARAQVVGADARRGPLRLPAGVRRPGALPPGLPRVLLRRRAERGRPGPVQDPAHEVELACPRGPAAAQPPPGRRPREAAAAQGAPTDRAGAWACWEPACAAAAGRASPRGAQGLRGAGVVGCGGPGAEGPSTIRASCGAQEPREAGGVECGVPSLEHSVANRPRDQNLSECQARGRGGR